MSVSREDQGNQSSVVLSEDQTQDELVVIGEVSGETKGGAVGAAPDIGAGYIYG
jgi:hypothetical protein